LAAGQQSNPANPTTRRSHHPRHCEEAQPTRQSSPSNNASGHMPFLTRWIATACGLAMTSLPPTLNAPAIHDHPRQMIHKSSISSPNDERFEY